MRRQHGEVAAVLALFRSERVVQDALLGPATKGLYGEYSGIVGPNDGGACRYPPRDSRCKPLLSEWRRMRSHVQARERKWRLIAVLKGAGASDNLALERQNEKRKDETYPA
jgi:hypothetical protein